MVCSIDGQQRVVELQVHGVVAGDDDRAVQVDVGGDGGLVSASAQHRAAFVERAAQIGDVGVVAAPGGQGGGGGVECLAQFEDVAFVRVGEVLAERAADVGGGDDVRARALAPFEHARVHERLDRLAHGIATGPGELGQLGLGGDPLAHRPAAGADLGAQLLGDLRDEAGASDGLHVSNSTGLREIAHSRLASVIRSSYDFRVPPLRDFQPASGAESTLVDDRRGRVDPSPEITRRSLIEGRLLVLAAIVLSALTLRAAVTAFTPLAEKIGAEVGFGTDDRRGVRHVADRHVRVCRARRRRCSCAGSGSNGRCSSRC